MTENLFAVNTQSELEHSVLGRISFTLSLLLGIPVIIFILSMSRILDLSSPISIYGTMVGSLVMPFSIFIFPLNLILAIVPLFQKKHKNLFPVLGLVLNLIVMASIIYFFYQTHSIYGNMFKY